MAKIIIKDGQLSSSAGINVPGSFSVSGNMVIGDSFTDTLIINSTTTFNDDLAVLDTISGSIGKFGTISGSVISASQYIGSITASPAGTSGQIQFNSNSVLSADSNFVWDNTNKRLGIGTSSPSARLDVDSAANAWARWKASSAAASFMSFVKGGTSTNIGYIGTDGGGIIAGGSGDHFGIRSEYDLLLMAGSTERARITSAGNVGIGTTSPVTPLNVAGEIRGNNFSDNFAGSFNINLGNGNIEGRGLVAGYSGGSYGGIGYNIRHTTTGGTYISPLADTSNYIQFSQGFQFLGDSGTTAGRTTNFTELMRITNAGNVGIGTTSPGYKLDVNGITRFQSILRFVNGSWNVSDTDSRNRFYFENNGTTYFGTGNNYVWRNPADTDIANLSTGGFDLSQGSYKFNGISVISNAGNDPYGNFRVLANNSSTIQDGMYIGYNSTGGTNAHIRFYANGVTERVRIDASNGNVGIGTGAPSTRLQVSDNVDPVATFTNTNNTTGTAAAIRLSTASSWAVKLKTVQSTDYFQMTDDSNVIGHSWFAKRYYPGSTSNNGANTGYISGDGTNISIGKATPTTKLDVDGAVCTTLGSAGAPSYSFNGDLNTGIYSPGADTIAFAEGGTEAMRINSSANVLIGTTSATTNRLSIAASTNDNLASIRLTNSFTTTGYWEIAVPGTGKNLDFLYNGNTRGYLSNSTNVSNIDFTGQHRSVPEDLEQLQENNIGLIVVSTGQYESFSSTNEISINEALPKVALSTQRNQKNVFGVISDKEDGDSSTREYRVGNFINVYDKQPEDSRLIINSLGEGGIWVCNVNGNLENGDYITSCEIPGYGMKQDDDLLHNYTVAKITCDCNFDLNSVVYLCEEFEFNGQIYKKAFVGCTYHCG